jgi:hypothetical protein
MAAKDRYTYLVAVEKRRADNARGKRNRNNILFGRFPSSPDGPDYRWPGER